MPISSQSNYQAPSDCQVAQLGAVVFHGDCFLFSKFMLLC